MDILYRMQLSQLSNKKAHGMLANAHANLCCSTVTHETLEESSSSCQRAYPFVSKNDFAACRVACTLLSRHPRQAVAVAVAVA